MKNSVNFNIVRRLFTALCLVLVAAGASAQFSGSGSGTADDPYRIYNAAQLNQVRNFLNDKDVVFSLEADIDMTDWIAENNPVQGWSPIGNSDNNAFCGTFNGNDHTISNLWIKRPDTDYIGLFGYAMSSTIRDITLSNAHYEGKDYVGGIVGIMQIERTESRTSTENSLYNCHFIYGKVKGSSRVGGIIGCGYANTDRYGNFNFGNTISLNGNMSNDCIIEGLDYIGGIVGYLSGDAPKIADSFTGISHTNCISNNCHIIGKNHIGGNIGYIY